MIGAKESKTLSNPHTHLDTAGSNTQTTEETKHSTQDSSNHHHRASPLNSIDEVVKEDGIAIE